MALAAGLLPGERGGALPWLTAFGTFLIVTATAAALALSAARGSIADAVAGRLTVSVNDADPARRDRTAARAEAALAHVSGVAQVRRVADDEVARLLAPYLGGAPLAALPLPALIDVTLRPGAARSGVDAALAGVRNARIEAAGQSLAPLALVIAAFRDIAIGIVAGVALGAALVTMLVARGALEAQRATVETLHGLGATDRQLAALVERRIAREAMIGAGVGLVAGFGALIATDARVAMLDGGLVAGAGLDIFGWSLLVLLPIGIVALAMLAARFALLWALERAER